MMTCIADNEGHGMTVAIVVKVSEGLALAADSALAVEGDIRQPDGSTQHGLLKVYNHASKLVQIGNWPLAVVTFGMGQIGSRTIDSHLREFADLQSADQPDSQPDTVEQVARELHNFMAVRHSATPHAGQLGLHVAGYPPKGFFPEQYLLTLPPAPEGAIQRVRPDRPDGSPDFGANWYGLTDAIIRLDKGIDPQAQSALTAAGVSAAQLAVTNSWEYPVIFEAMPLQDAIDFADWLANVTIGRFRFVVGPAMVVGPVDLAVITRHEGFTWIRRKSPKASTEQPFVF
jgi:hypothetical protein